ncbi:cytochrome c biogenesis CcdA family protein [Euzebya pacifica]|jgi:cytochrome c-type biogenesis protein|uniref:cytochrome c biogenesis CcdA family protein n=1 Tax=Euzebya pacifica TaxID=1608957 RepID=UPI0030FA754A
MEFLTMGSLAFVAGILSFTSPCCLPLMPGYLSYISTAAHDTPGPDGQSTTAGAGTTVTVARRARTRALTSALLFVLGFGVVFTALGAGASAASSLLLTNRVLLSRVGGVIIIVMGLVLAGVVRVPLLMREYRFDLSRVRPGPAGAVPLGMAFAIGWVPCIGPVLAGILTVAASDGSVGRGAALLAIYSAGLGIPFVGLAVAASRLQPAVAWLRRHARGVELAGGGVMIVMGVLLLTNQWLRFFAPLTSLFSRFGWPPL